MWPKEWLQAYVVMELKAAGGTRPRDQRPITVLELVYRIWSKGVTMQLDHTLQTAYLGDAAMGFRSGMGTLHLAQLLVDVVRLQRMRGCELFLVSFDLEKCYDSLPWWALFGTMRQSGIPECLVTCLEHFYKGLVRRFRYGQVDGEQWQAANGLPQGCPPSPGLPNLLMEPFHRWA